MKLFKIFLTLFLLVGLFFAGSLFFPSRYHIDRSIHIERPVDTAFHFMADLRNWHTWSLWNKQTDSTYREFFGKRSDSLGGRMYFQGEKLGEGRFLLDTYEHNKLIGYNLYMNKGDIQAKGLFQFEMGDASSCTLHWIDSGDVGYNPIFRYLMANKVSQTERVFDEGLQRIKKVIESQ